MKINLRIWARVLLLAGAAMTGATVQAACQMTANDGDEYTPTVLDVTLDFPDGVINVPRNAPVGTIIARANIVRKLSNGRQTMTCWAPTTFTDSVQGSPSASIAPNGTEGRFRGGIMYKIVYSDGTSPRLRGDRTVAFPLSGPGTTMFSYFGQSVASFRAGLAVVLYKSADTIISETSFPAGLQFRQAINGRDILTVRTSREIEIMNNQTCSVNAPRAVHLGQHSSKIFGAVGATSPATPFQIAVDCTGLKSKVFMTMSDPRNTGNSGSTLPLTSSSTARGVGVQILRGADDTLVSYGTDSSAAGNRNQFKLFDATAATPTHLAVFKARYIQTAENVTPGTANSVVTFTMSYQ